MPILQWEWIPMEPYPNLEFPSQAVMAHLVDIYFHRTNPLIPILHRPTFEASMAEGLHKRNYYFGATGLSIRPRHIQFAYPDCCR